MKELELEKTGSKSSGKHRGTVRFHRIVTDEKFSFGFASRQRIAGQFSFDQYVCSPKGALQCYVSFQREEGRFVFRE